MRDFLGNELSVGDKVVFVDQPTRDRFAQLHKAIVSGFSSGRRHLVEFAGLARRKEPHKVIKVEW